MSKAPEWIYLDGDVEAGDGMFPRCFENPKYASEPQVEYIRADLVRAAVAAALREAAELNGWWLSINYAGEPDGTFCSVQPSDDALAEKYVRASRILALITDDAQAALDRALAAERERCAKIADKCKRENGPLSKKGFNEQYRRGLEAAGQAIAAAIRAELTGGKDE